MTKDEFKVLCKAMKAVYPQETFLPDNDAFNVWYSLLKDLPYKTASMAIQKYMVTEKFPPTIADIRSKAAEIVSPETDEMSELKAWQLVVKATCNSNYNADEEFAKLPVACQKAVGSPDILRTWARMDSKTFHSVEQSHFLRSYKAAVTQIKNDAKLPPAMLEMIRNGTAIEHEEQMMIGEAE